MPVTIKLLDLVAIPEASHLVPPELTAFLTSIGKKPNGKTGWGACADWLDEHDEPELARAFRYVCKRAGVTVAYREYERAWEVSGLPRLIEDVDLPDNLDTNESTILGAMHALYHRLVAAEKKIAEAKEDLA